MEFDYIYQEDKDIKYIYKGDIGYKWRRFPIFYPPQEQDKQPGMEYLMHPRPKFFDACYKASGKLKDKVAIVTGGDSGIGRAVSLYYALEGAKVVIVYLNEHIDALETKKYIEDIGGEVLLLSGDLTDKEFCRYVIDETIKTYKKIDILVNNAGVQYTKKTLLDISDEQFDKTMKTNVYSMFYITREALKYMKEGSSIINVSSITTFYGEPYLIDYVTSKGAVVGFTRSLASNLGKKKIRVNAVAPGFFWTPLQPACWEALKMPTLGINSDFVRGGETKEIAPLFVYLASDDASYVTGQVIHINGGEYKG